MKVSEYLSIGTVVKLKNISKRVVISGIRQMFEGKEYDYQAVPYPEGHLEDGEMILFFQDDIEAIYMLGYTDKERIQMIKTLGNK